VNIYVANSDGDWLDRHDSHRDITDTDWWSKTKFFWKASVGDLFFVRRIHTNELCVWATIKHVSKDEAPQTAWQYSSEAYPADMHYQERAARVLGIPEEQISTDSRITLIALENLVWFPPEQQPSLPSRVFAGNPAGLVCLESNPQHKYLSEFVAQYPVAPAGATPRDRYIRVTEAQWAEIFPLHTELAGRFERWLDERGFQYVRREQHWVDVQFSRDGKSFLAELKICYDLNTRQAIRDAIGQVLEYNHYSGRVQADEWWVILDRKPTENDAAYIGQLRKHHRMPVYLGYEASPGIGGFVVLNT
jgi:hypothetical protein